MKSIIITGGCGFTGHHFVEHFLKNTNWHINIFDRLTYASFGLDRLRDIKAFSEDRVSLFSLDITRPISVGVLNETANSEYILHLAAETHVDRSIVDPFPFVMSNVIGTFNMLEFAKEMDSGFKKFVYFSTDEVFGPAHGYDYKEWDRYNSTNPYSATKAGGEELCLAYANCYNLPIIITHTMNMFGERQHPEKFIPLCISKILKGEEVTIHSDNTKTKSGSRFYIHSRNVADAVNMLLSLNVTRDKFNIVGEREVTNLELAQMIADIIGKPLKYEMVDFHSSRPGHDLRYALDGEKMRKLNWWPPLGFEKSLEKVVNWTLDNRRWLCL